LQHIEFFHTDHFEEHYHRVKPRPGPEGFSDALFPNIGYTYLINLGTPFSMQIENEIFEMKKDGFLPRQRAIECYHRQGNQLFGIKFKISPVIFKNRINFSEYKAFIYPLTYLMEQAVIDKVKNAGSFVERVQLLEEYFLSIVEAYSGSWEPIRIVAEILQRCDEQNDFTVSVESLAEQYGISARTLQRYFEATTSLSSKKALQIMRIRKATTHLVNSPANFHYTLYGYYDRSHFYKHLKSFLRKDTLKSLQPHLMLLGKLHRSA